MSYNIIAKYIKNINFNIPNMDSYFLIEKNISNYKINFDIKSKKIKDIVISDFGSSTWDGSLCKYGKTSCYRSVNIILNEAPEPADDVWSMGCILFEAVTNQYLFDPDTLNATKDSGQYVGIVRVIRLVPRSANEITGRPY